MLSSILPINHLIIKTYLGLTVSPLQQASALLPHPTPPQPVYQPVLA